MMDVKVCGILELCVDVIAAQRNDVIVFLVIIFDMAIFERLGQEVPPSFIRANRIRRVHHSISERGDQLERLRVPGEVTLD